MKCLCIAFAAAALVIGCQDTNEDDAKGASSTTGADSSLKTDAKTAGTAKPPAPGSGTGASASAAKPLEYQEIRSGNKTYVVGSKEAAEQAKAGKLEKPQLGIGFGAPGEKVYFEDKNADALQAEFIKRRAGR